MMILYLCYCTTARTCAGGAALFESCTVHHTVRTRTRFFMKKGSGTFFVYRKFCGRTTRNGKRAKAGYRHDGGTLPFAILHRVWYTQLNNSEVGMEIYMRNYEIENEMYRRAVELIETRYPVGWGGAGVVHTSNGNYYTSVSIETANASAVLCIETGAMLEAHKFNEKVTHCMCLVRKDEKSPYQILSPCGICQERLRYWGEDVQVAVTTEEEKIKFVQLKELQPYHWTKAYPAEELEHWNE